MNKKSFKLIGLVALVASTVLLVACQSDTKNESSKSKDVQWGVYWCYWSRPLG